MKDSVSALPVLRRIFVFALLFLVSSVSRAAIESAASRINGTGVVTGASVTAIDNKYSFMQANPSTWYTNNFKVASAKGRVRVGVDHGSLVYVGNSWDYTFYLKIQYKDTSISTTTTIYRQLRSAYDYLAALPPDQRPDAVVSDIAMPEEDGYSFMRRVRSLPSAGSAGGKPRRMVALALTAFAGDEDRARSMRAGFDVHVGKPIDSAMLLETLRSALIPKQSAMRRAS